MLYHEEKYGSNIFCLSLDNSEKKRRKNCHLLIVKILLMTLFCLDMTVFDLIIIRLLKKAASSAYQALRLLNFFHAQLN